MNDNKQIQTSINAAWEWFHNNHAAYLQALIYILKSRAVTFADEASNAAYEKLGLYAAPLGMDQIAYFRANLFYSQVSGLELFLQRTIKAVVSQYPKKLGSVQFRLSQIADATSIDELITQASEEYLNRLMYKKPLEYLQDICETLSIEQKKLESCWPDFVEAKARRDVGIHNNWICNETYLRKVGEAGLVVQCNIGDSLVPIDNDYMFKATDQLRTVAQVVLLELSEKYK